MRRGVIVLALLTFACGGDTPTTPSIPPANLVSQGNLTFPSCSFDQCGFEGEARNFGAGCGTNVRGITRLFNSSNAQVAVSEWRLSASRTVRPNEAFLYSGCCFALRDANTTGFYRTEISWTDTRCSS